MLYTIYERFRWWHKRARDVRIRVTHEHGQYYAIVSGSYIRRLHGHEPLANSAKQLPELLEGTATALRTLERHRGWRHPTAPLSEGDDFPGHPGQ